MFILDFLVEQWQVVKIGDCVCLSDVSVESGPGQTCRVVLEENSDRPPRIWFLKMNQGPAPKVKPKVEYTYTKLKDVKSGTTVNTWGVVQSCQPPKRSRGTDCVQVIGISDPSYKSADSRLICLLFGVTPEKLPQNVAVGDIIRFHRLKIITYNGRLQGGTGPGFSWLLFKPPLESPLMPSASSSENYSYTDKDKEKAMELFEWLQPSVELEDSLSKDGDPAPSTSGTTRRAGSPQTKPSPPLAQPSVSRTADKDGAATADSSRNTAAQPLQYSELGHVKVNKVVNTLGVIIYHKQASETSRKEFVLTFSIVDPTLKRNQKLKCLLFSDKVDTLPTSALVGQVICLRNLKIIEFRGELQGLGAAGFSWTVYCSPQPEVASPIYSSSGKPQEVDEGESEKVIQLQQWASQQHLLLHQRCSRLSQMIIRDYFDLVCQVVEICELEPSRCMLLRVWDGSKPKISVFGAGAMTENLKTQSNRRLREQSYGLTVDVFVYDDHVTTAACLKPGDVILMTNLHAMEHTLMMGEEDTGPKAELCLHGGTAYSRGLRLLEANTDTLLEMLTERLAEMAPGPSAGFDKVRSSPDVEPCPKKALLKDNLPSPQKTPSKTGSPGMSTSSLTRRPLREDTPAEPPDNQQDSQDSESQSKILRCMQRSATVLTANHHIKVTSIRDVITHPPPYKFRICAQLITYEPRHKSLYCLYCPTCRHLQGDDGSSPDRQSVSKETCLHCQRSGNSSAAELSNILRLQLTLADQTGWLQANLSGEQAEVFFADLVCLSSSSPIERIRSVLQEISPSKPDINGKYIRPWLECCVASYRAQQQTCFYIFDTMLAINE